MLYKLIVAFLIFVVPANVLAGESFVCLGEKATGFHWNGSDWAIANFKVSEDKFLVKETPPSELFGTTYNYEVRRFGADKRLFRCERFKIGKSYSSRIRCGGLGSGMLIDVKSMRFQEVYGFGYIDGKDQPGNTPSITIGKCSRLN